jgi:hypothetical protein
MRPTDSENSERAQRIQRIVDECIARSASGQVVSYEEVVAVHPELMPELGEELRKLALINQACRRARETGDAD